MTKKHTHQEWQKYISQWKESHLSQRVFCQENALRLSTFGYWMRKLREAEKPMEASSSLVRISIPSKNEKPETASQIILQTPNHYRIELSTPVDCESLKAILEIL